MPPPQPIRVMLGNTSLADVRHLFPNAGTTSTGKAIDPQALRGIAIHHDGVIFASGDTDYDGTSLDEDVGRLEVIYQHALAQGWGGFPYHLAATPNGRTFLCRPILTRGAHVAQRNHELLGIALLGDFTLRQPSPAHLCAAGLALLAARKLTARELPIAGHRTYARPYYPTSCPGDTVSTWLPLLDRYAEVHEAIAFR